MQINVHGQATFFYFLSKEQAGIQFFLSLHRLPTFLIWCGSKCLQEFIFAVWQFLMFCGNYFLQIRTDWFFFPGIIFCDFYNVLDPVLIIFLFLIEYMQWKYIFWNNTTVCIPYVKPVFHCRPFCFWTKKASFNWENTIFWYCIFGWQI